MASTLIEQQAEAQAAAEAAAAIPTKGPDTTFGGLGPNATWPDVYAHIEAIAHKVREDVEAQLGTNGSFITLEIQAYIGALLQVVSTYVVNLHDAMLIHVNDLWTSLILTQQDYQSQIDRQDAILTDLVTSNYETREGIIPALLQQIANLEQEVKERDLIVEEQMQQWTLDNIYRPLQQQTQLMDQATREREIVLAQQQFHYTDDQVQREEWERVAAVLVAQQQLNIIETEFAQCVNPMCETMGPNTNLFKTLKSLEGLLGALAGISLATLTFPEIERIAGFFQSITTGDATKFVNAFVGGGASVGSAAGTIIGDLGHVASEAFSAVV